jgi:hypothetical protein
MQACICHATIASPGHKLRNSGVESPFESHGHDMERLGNVPHTSVRVVCHYNSLFDKHSLINSCKRTQINYSRMCIIEKAFLIWISGECATTVTHLQCGTLPVKPPGGVYSES